MPIFILNIGQFTLAPTWYGAMYAGVFCFFYFVLTSEKISEKNKDYIFWYTILGVILGGRFGYVILYNLTYYLEHPIEILMPWKGGMSFHGGVIGVVITWYLLSNKIKKPYLEIVDSYVWIVPIGLFFGRFGNYINGELLGIPGYSGPAARIIDGVSYFPTPLLEMFLEGFVLGAILMWKRKNQHYSGELGVWFLGLYSIMRFIAEFFRTPDLQVGYVLTNWMTLGHVLSILLFVISLVLYYLLKDQKNQQNFPKEFSQ